MRGDPSAEALSYKQVSRSASEPLPLSLVIVKTPCGQRVILREAEKKRRSRFAAWKAECAAAKRRVGRRRRSRSDAQAPARGIEGHNRRASGARDSSEPSRSGSEAEHVWNVTPGTWEVCGAKALQKSDEVIVALKRGNARGYPPSRRRVAKRCPSRGAASSQSVRSWRGILPFRSCRGRRSRARPSLSPARGHRARAGSMDAPCAFAPPLRRQH